MYKSIVSLFLVFTLLLAGCGKVTPSSLVTALNAVADAANVAVVVTSSLVVSGTVSQSVATQVQTYATGIDQAVAASIAELNSADTNPVKIANISAAFAKVAAPAFGTQAPAITAAISAVTAAVDIFLQQLNSNGVLTAAKAAPKVSPALVLSHGDKSMLKKIQTKVAATNVLAAKLVKK
jgi:hypothetical protein